MFLGRNLAVRRTVSRKAIMISMREKLLCSRVSIDEKTEIVTKASSIRRRS